MLTDNTLSLRQKKQYIKRHIDNDILCLETTKDIYRTVRNSNCPHAIRNSKNINNYGVFIDLNKLTDESIDQIYYIVKKRLENIAMK